MKKLLLVDDEPTNLNLLREILHEHYQLLFAISGRDALNAATKHLPDLILLDVAMPGMDGYEVCRQLHQNAATRSIPILFVTALEGEQWPRLSEHPGAVDVLAKPVERTTVLAHVMTLCPPQ